MFDWSFFSVIRPYIGFVAGGHFFGKPETKDVDFVVGVPDHEIAEVERSLESKGFKRTVPDSATCDKRIVSGFKLDYHDKSGYWDIQITTPAVAAARLKAMHRIKKSGAQKGIDKRALYALYDQMYEV